MFIGVGASCKKKNPEQTEQVNTDKATFEGTHVYTAEETNKPFITNGRTDYVLVLPNKSSDNIATASSEFTYFFEKATNIKISTFKETDSEGVDQALTGKKCISIGQTKLLKNAGLTIDYTALGEDGHIIETTDDGNIYLVGGSDFGSMYSVYTFMQVTFNYKCYYNDLYVIDENVNNMNLKDYQVIDIPDIAIRAKGYGIYRSSKDYDTKMFQHRMRTSRERGANLMRIHKDYTTTSDAATSTNADCYFPEEIYYEKHPMWYSTKSTPGRRHVCFNAGGHFETTTDEDGNVIPSEYDQMVEEAAKKIQFSLTVYTPDKYPNDTACSLTTQDNTNYCECDACLADLNKYGTRSGAAGEFVSDVGKKVKEWMAKEENAAYRREDFKIIFFAYQEYAKPPVTYDEETKTYTPIDGFKLEDNVGVYLAPNKEFNLYTNVYDEKNAEGRKVVEGWQSLTDTIYLWLHSANFMGYLYINPTFDFQTSEGFTWIASKKPTQLVIESVYVSNPTAWYALKVYLDATLSWNCSLDTQALVDEWFDAMYGAAAQAMKTQFYIQTGYTKKMMLDNQLLETGQISRSMKKAQYWPLATLESWVTGFDEAKALLNEKDPNYKIYCNHIDTEQMSPLWIMLSLYGTRFNPATKASLNSKLETILRELGCMNMSTAQGDTIGDVLKQ
jgi:hypothetical protein